MLFDHCLACDPRQTSWVEVLPSWSYGPREVCAGLHLQKFYSVVGPKVCWYMANIANEMVDS